MTVINVHEAKTQYAVGAAFLVCPGFRSLTVKFKDRERGYSVPEKWSKALRYLLHTSLNAGLRCTLDVRCAHINFTHRYARLRMPHGGDLDPYVFSGGLQTIESYN